MSYHLNNWQQGTLHLAKSHLGERERTGHNDGRLPRLVQRFIAAGAAWLDNQPWCCCFALWCAFTAAAALGIRPQLPKTASTSALFRWFKSRKKLLEKPVPGCIAMVRGGLTGHRHTFLVHDVTDGLGRSVLNGTLSLSAVGPASLVIGVDGNYRNAVGWSKRRVRECDYGPLC